jgi:hypothetical protein
MARCMQQILCVIAASVWNLSAQAISIEPKAVALSSDSKTLSFQIEGNRVQVDLSEFTPQFGGVYFLSAEYGPGASFNVYLWFVGSLPTKASPKPLPILLNGHVWNIHGYESETVAIHDSTKIQLGVYGWLIQEPKTFQLRVHSIQGLPINGAKSHSLSMSFKPIPGLGKS